MANGNHSAVQVFNSAQEGTPLENLALAVCLQAVEDYKADYHVPRGFNHAKPYCNRRDIIDDMQESPFWVAVTGIEFNTIIEKM